MLTKDSNSKNSLVIDQVAGLELRIFYSSEAVKPIWNSPDIAWVGCPYNSFKWLSAWSSSLGKTLKIEPIICVVFKKDTPVLLLPLGLEETAGVKTLSFLGYHHGNQNTALWEFSFYKAITREQVTKLLKALRKLVAADLLILQNIPREWLDRPHPLVLFGASTSPSPIFSSRVTQNFGELFQAKHSKSSRKNLLRKERNLQSAGEYRVARASCLTEFKGGLDAFLCQRAKRSETAGIPNVFDTPEARQFLSKVIGVETCDPSSTLLDVWFLEVGGLIRSTYLTIEHEDTLYAYSNSISQDETMPNSPGLVLIKEIFSYACSQPSLKFVDLGLGEERYKTAWASPIALVDSFYALSVKGFFSLILKRSKLQAKYYLRNSKLLWPVIRCLKRSRRKQSNAPG